MKIHVLFLSIGYIEILATCMLLQILLNMNQAIAAFNRGDYLEGACHLISSALTMTKVIPQMRVIEWK